MSKKHKHEQEHQESAGGVEAAETTAATEPAPPSPEEALAASQAEVQKNWDLYLRRITSYNVCYTKLLR